MGREIANSISRLIAKKTMEAAMRKQNEFAGALVGIAGAVTEKTDTIIAHGTIQPGAYFTGKLTTYGGDCAGGNGTSSSGISLSPTTGVKGSHSAKLSYNGGSYYCLAADPSIPFGTIIKITNHNLGIESTAYGIVVDRGGAIKKNHIENGLTEKELEMFRVK